jgi:hypothetical protein
MKAVPPDQAVSLWQTVHAQAVAVIEIPTKNILDTASHNAFRSGCARNKSAGLLITGREKS